jgi:hypothetical protein
MCEHSLSVRLSSLHPRATHGPRGLVHQTRLPAMLALALLACSEELVVPVDASDRELAAMRDATDGDELQDVVTPDGATDGGEVLPRTPRRLTARYNHTCYRLDAVQRWCWGSNGYGELGVAPPGGPTQDARATPIPDRIMSAAELVAGPASTALVVEGGAVFLRGEHAALRAVTMPPHPAAHPAWIAVDWWSRPVSLVLANGLVCAIREARVECVGEDPGGERAPAVADAGADGALRRATPIAGFVGAVQVDVGASHLCAVRRDGRVFCGGRNLDGECGAAPSAVHAPGAVEGLPPATEVAVGLRYTCARTLAGEVWCWGRNFNGQLGDGTTLSRPTPRRVEGLQDVTALALSPPGSVCAVSNGRVACWGWPVEAFSPSGPLLGSRPASVEGLTNVEELVVGEAHACALTRDGRVLCWGDRAVGQVGDGTVARLQPARTPVEVRFPR